jgi:hypothetical protein
MKNKTETKAFLISFVIFAIIFMIPAIFFAKQSSQKSNDNTTSLADSTSTYSNELIAVSKADYTTMPFGPIDAFFTVISPESKPVCGKLKFKGTSQESQNENKGWVDTDEMDFCATKDGSVVQVPINAEKVNNILSDEAWLKLAADTYYKELDVPQDLSKFEGVSAGNTSSPFSKVLYSTYCLPFPVDLFGICKPSDNLAAAKSIRIHSDSNLTVSPLEAYYQKLVDDPMINKKQGFTVTTTTPKSGTYLVVVQQNADFVSSEINKSVNTTFTVNTIDPMAFDVSSDTPGYFSSENILISDVKVAETVLQPAKIAAYTGQTKFWNAISQCGNLPYLGSYFAASFSGVRPTDKNYVQELYGNFGLPLSVYFCTEQAAKTAGM